MPLPPKCVTSVMDDPQGSWDISHLDAGMSEIPECGNGHANNWIPRGVGVGITAMRNGDFKPGVPAL